MTPYAVNPPLMRQHMLLDSDTSTSPSSSMANPVLISFYNLAVLLLISLVGYLVINGVISLIKMVVRRSDRSTPSSPLPLSARSSEPSSPMTEVRRMYPAEKEV